MRAAIALALALFALQPAAAPKLAVIIVVDQMRADYIDRFQKDWTGGLKRLVSGGAVFTNAAYPYLSTVTCAGHATIATGTFPHTHGVILNAWWDRETGAAMTCTEDRRATGIGYRTRAAHGDSAWRLHRPTFTDLMRAQRGARVVTLSNKDRSAIMLAGHGADAVTWLSDSLDGWMTSSVFGDGGPVPAVKAFLEANPIANDFGKTWTRLLADSHYPDPDDAPGEAPPRGWTRTFPHVLNGTVNQPDATFFAQWERSPFANAYLGRFAAALVDAFTLGRNSGTDVLGISFSAPDTVGHAFGPRSVEQRDLYLRLDRTMGELFDHLDQTVGADRWIAALSSDHGITPLPEQLREEGKDGGRLPASVVAAAIIDRLRTTLKENAPVAQLAGNDIYFAAGVYDKLLRSPKALDAVVQTIRDIPGVARVFRAEELRDPAAARDPLQRAAALGYFPGRSGDLIMALKPGWIFAGSGAQHGSAASDDQRVPLVFLGAGVKPGRYGDQASPADLAPTLASLLGVSMPDVEGRALVAAFAK